MLSLLPRQVLMKRIPNSNLHQHCLVFRGGSSKCHPPPHITHHSILLEEPPALVIGEEADVDLIGPPDPLSNLRPILRTEPLKNETPLQRRQRDMQAATQRWNQTFWAEHNTRFIQEREAFIASSKRQDCDANLTADEMSEFYKQFLDRNWHKHVQYNWQWYQRNFLLAYLALRVSLEKFYYFR